MDVATLEEPSGRLKLTKTARVILPIHLRNLQVFNDPFHTLESLRTTRHDELPAFEAVLANQRNR